MPAAKRHSKAHSTEGTEAAVFASVLPPSPTYPYPVWPFSNAKPFAAASVSLIVFIVEIYGSVSKHLTCTRA